MELAPGWKGESPAKEKAPFAQAPDAAAVPVPVAPDFGRGRRILVVDDNEVVLKAFEFKLKAFGFEVSTATEGSVAVKLARKTKPEVVLLDINFPPEVLGGSVQWDGFSILQWLHRSEEIAGVPIIIISSSDAAKFGPKAIAAGAADFFQKPVNYPDLMRRLQELLKNPVSPAAPPNPGPA